MSGTISLAKHNASLARVRARTAQAGDAIVEPMLHAALGAAVTYAQSKVPDTMFDGMVPTLLVATAVARYAALKSTGNTRKIGTATSNALAVLYGAEAMRRGSLIAGQ